MLNNDNQHAIRDDNNNHINAFNYDNQHAIRDDNNN